MTAVSFTHLDDYALAGLALGDLPPALGAEVREHLHRCAACAERFARVAAEADACAEAGEQALTFEAAPAPAPSVRLAEVAKPDGGAVLMFPRKVEGQRAAPAGLSRLASRVFGQFGQLLHAAAGVPDEQLALEVVASAEVHELSGTIGESVDVWFGNPHPRAAWLTVLRQPTGAALPPVVCDGPRALQPGRNAGAPTRLPVAKTDDLVLAVLTEEEPPAKERVQESLALGVFSVFDAYKPLGQVVCRVAPR